MLLLKRVKSHAGLFEVGMTRCFHGVHVVQQRAVESDALRMLAMHKAKSFTLHGRQRTYYCSERPAVGHDVK